MTIEEFGRAVKKKYPQYDSINDADLGRMTMEKYPEYQRVLDGSFKTPETTQTEKKGFFQNIKESFGKRAESLSQGYARQSAGEQTLGESVGQTVGETIGLAGDILFEGAKAVTPDFIEKGIGEVAKYGIGEIAKTPVGQTIGKTIESGMDVYGGLSPRTQANIRAAGNIASVIPIGRGAKVAGSVAKDIVQPALKEGGELALKGAKKLGTGVAKTTEFAVAQATGLSPKTIKEVILNPKAFTQSEMKAVSREAIGSRVYQGIVKRLDDLSDIGTGYNTLRTSAQKVEVPDNFFKDILENRFKIFLDDTGKVITSKASKPITTSDATAIEKFMREYGTGGIYTADEFLNTREALAQMAKYEVASGKSSASQLVGETIREEFNKFFRPKIKGLAELDAKYAPEVKMLKQIKKEYLNPLTGELKDNALSKIANLTKEGRQPVLERLKKIIPDIEEDLRILRAIEDIGYAQGQKVGSYGRTLIGVGGGFAAGGLVGALIGQVLTSPQLAIAILRQYGLLKRALQPFLNNLTSKMKRGIKLTKAELAVLNQAIDEMAQKLETKAKNIPAGLSIKDVTTMNPDELAKTGIKIDKVSKKTIAGKSGELSKMNNEELKKMWQEGSYKNLVEKLESPYYKELNRRIKLERNDLVTKKSRNLYHTTPVDNLESIAKEGLVTGKKARFEGVSSNNKLSFSANEEGAKYYGGNNDVMLRTKTSYKPKDLDVDLLAGGEGTYVTGQNIPPEMLEIKINGKWVDLQKYKRTVIDKTDDLLSEAKKYKSAEEFVKGQGEPLYHGTKADFNEFRDAENTGVYGKGIYFYSDNPLPKISVNAKEMASSYGNVVEAYAPGKLANVNDFEKALELAKKQGAMVGKKYAMAVEILKEKGFVGIKDFEVVNIFDAKNIKTKSQLTDIWKKANKK